MDDALESELKWEIKNKELQRINNKRAKLAEIAATYEAQVENLVASKTTYENIQYLINDIEDHIEKARPINNFDRIAKKDIERTIYALKTYYDFFEPKKETPKSKRTTIQQVLTALYGTEETPNVYQSLIARLGNFKDDLQHQYDTILDNVETYTLERNTDNNIKRAKEVLQTIKPHLEDYIRAIGLYDENFKYELDIAPILYEFSGYWKSGTKEAGINEEDVYFYRDKKSTNVFKGVLYLTAIHELLGHGVAQRLSENAMPNGMNYGAEGFMMPTHSMVSEGVAVMTEKLCMNWFKKKKNELGLTNKELKIMYMAPEVYLQKRIAQICHSIFHVEEDRKPNFKAHKQLAKITGIKRYGIDEYLFDDCSLTSMLEFINYPMGYKHIEGIMADIRKKYGLIFERRNRNLILRGLLTASMTPDAQKEFFFTEYMPRVEKYFNKRKGDRTMSIPTKAEVKTEELDKEKPDTQQKTEEMATEQKIAEKSPLQQNNP